jgi:DNA helicase-2/ATP-dependent DNA helicase PcrA
MQHGSGDSDYEKIKLHKYRQQLMFYKIMIENSRDYSKYPVTGAKLIFVEPES